MIEILRKIFEANPEKSKIVLKKKCSDCGCDTIIEITPTSGGYGLQGGVLVKSSTDNFIVKCPDCHETNLKIDHNQKKWKINI
jgi:Zn finger protein HypA/HybF involved in hydrogenase expression